MKWPQRRPLTWLVDVKRLVWQMGQSLSMPLRKQACLGVLDEMHALQVMQWKKSWGGAAGGGVVGKKKPVPPTGSWVESTKDGEKARSERQPALAR